MAALPEDLGEVGPGRDGALAASLDDAGQIGERAGVVFLFIRHCAAARHSACPSIRALLNSIYRWRLRRWASGVPVKGYSSGGSVDIGSGAAHDSSPRASVWEIGNVGNSPADGLQAVGQSRSIESATDGCAVAATDNAVTKRLNERPRKSLNHQPPAEQFSQCVASTG